MALLMVVVFALFSSIPVKAYADTVSMTYENPGGQSSGNAYVYPYNFSINGSTTLTPLMCLSFTQEISQGESWQATIEQVAGNTEYEEAAYIFSLAAAPGASSDTIAEAQWANWELFDSGASSSLPGSVNQTDVTNMLNAAAAYAGNPSNSNSSFYSEYTIYLPVTGSQPAGDDIPQTFIGGSSSQNYTGGSPTPEPGSMVLLGTGMLGLATFFYRRSRIA